MIAQFFTIFLYFPPEGWRPKPFLKATSEAQSQAHDIIQHLATEMRSLSNNITLDEVLWGSFITPLTDSVFYEDRAFLQQTRDLLLGRFSRTQFTAVYNEDVIPYFTTDEAAWYAHLLGMLDFLLEIPFATLHEAIAPALRNKERWETLRERIPEVTQLERFQHDYEQRKKRLETFVDGHPAPKHPGDEIIYRFVLREVTSILTAIWVVPAVANLGYPIPGGPDVTILGAEMNQFPDMTDHIVWAKRTLEKLRNEEALIFSWRLHKGTPPDSDVLFVALR